MLQYTCQYTTDKLWCQQRSRGFLIIRATEPCFVQASLYILCNISSKIHCCVGLDCVCITLISINCSALLLLAARAQIVPALLTRLITEDKGCIDLALPFVLACECCY